MKKSVAARALATALYRSGVIEGEQTFRESVAYLPSAGKEGWGDFAAWFNSQDSVTKNHVLFAVRQAVITATHGIAIMFDGAAGFEEIEGKACEFTISLRVFPDDQHTSPDDAEEIIPICPPESGEDVHDLIMALTDGEKI